MTDKTGISVLMAAHIMREAGLSHTTVKKALEELHRPVSGYLYSEDVNQFIITNKQNN